MFAPDRHNGGNNPSDSPLDGLLDIELPLTLRFGSKRMVLGEIIGLDPGSVIDFDRAADEPVQILVNGRAVAYGETVVVRGNYGVRISRAVTSGERMDTISNLSLGDSGGAQKVL